jgi:hypothetical protein
MVIRGTSHVSCEFLHRRKLIHSYEENIFAGLLSFAWKNTYFYLHIFNMFLSSYSAKKEIAFFSFPGEAQNPLTELSLEAQIMVLLGLGVGQENWPDQNFKHF